MTEKILFITKTIFKDFNNDGHISFGFRINGPNDINVYCNLLDEKELNKKGVDFLKHIYNNYGSFIKNILIDAVDKKYDVEVDYEKIPNKKIIEEIL